MNTTVPRPRPPRTWRDLPQVLPPRAVSRQGRRRLLLAGGRAAGFSALAVLAAWGVCEVVGLWRSDPRKLATAVRSAPVRDGGVSTDGVLDKAWVLQTLALPASAGLMEIDLYDLRARLEAGRQVRAAVLTRNFPDTLVVSLRERLPVVRLRAQTGAAPSRDLLVARDGVVYDGAGYPPTLLEKLPYLDGVKLSGTARGGCAPIEGMDTVANLLVAAQLDAPHLYREWKIISLERLAGFDEIIVRSSEVPEAVFSRRDNFSLQLARLDTVIDYARSQGAVLGRVDLTLGGSVPVQMEPAAAIFPPFSHSLQRKTNREL